MLTLQGGISMPENETAAIVGLPKLIDDRESDPGISCPLPTSFEQIGKVVHWEGTQNFLEIGCADTHNYAILS